VPAIADLLDLSRRSAVVTGAAQGFGAAIAARLAEAGALVVVADVSVEGAMQQAATLAGRGLRAVGVGADVTDPDAVQNMIDRAVAETGRLDVLVNNAGVFSNYLATAMPAGELERILRVNVIGTFTCAQTAARAMLADGRGGAIVNIASVDSFRGSAEGLSHYTTSKHAVAGLTRSLAMELGPQGIRVNAVCPGAALTEGAVAFVEEGAPAGIDLAAQWDGIVSRTPLGRLCEVEDVANAVLYLASDMASFVTGVLLPVDGGILVYPLEGYADPAGGNE
jgi:2-deoxy-D-gluconate 3-dehydrogenase